MRAAASCLRYSALVHVLATFQRGSGDSHIAPIRHYGLHVREGFAGGAAPLLSSAPACDICEFTRLACGIADVAWLPTHDCAQLLSACSPAQASWWPTMRT